MIRHISLPVVGPQWHRSDLFCYNPATRSVELEGESAVTQVSSGSRVVDQARDALAAFVRSAPEGSKLPPERELAQKLGVSRTTLRDGVSRLALLGLLEVRHGDGTYVRSPDATQLAMPFRSLLEYNPEAPSELLALKRLLEPALAAAAALNATDEDVVALRGAVQQERSELLRQADKRRVGRRQPAKRSLEALIIGAAGSSLVGTLVGLATELLRPSLAERLPPAFRQLAVEQRAAIVEAIAVGEPEAARGAMELHLNTLTKALEAVEPGSFGRSDANGRTSALAS